MIVDIEKFILKERKCWDELEGVLNRLENNPGYRMDLGQVNKFHYLYQRTSADLSRIMTFSSEPATREYLESLVRRAYAEISSDTSKRYSFSLRHWFFYTFPRVFRRNINAFWLAMFVTLAGAAFGGLALSLDPEAKEIIMPFWHLQMDPSRRVAQEEEKTTDRDSLGGAKTTFSAYLMTHNTKVSITAMAMGVTWGIGTIILLLYNGVILGAVMVDYCLAGQTKFVLGWLLPHGAVEIPAVTIAGQAGLVLAAAVIGKAGRASLMMRMREVWGEVVTLISGVAILLVWAGIIEAFLSQYHEPIISYEVKIVFGLIEVILLVLFLAMSGSKRAEKPKGAT